MSGSWQKCFERRSLRRSFALFCQSEAMQLDRSRMLEETPCCERQVAAAKPDGPAPTMMVLSSSDVALPSDPISMEDDET
ncbi:hypothetical protein QQ045_023405 [Rhodiola kirilowii]